MSGATTVTLLKFVLTCFPSGAIIPCPDTSLDVITYIGDSAVRVIDWSVASLRRTTFHVTILVAHRHYKTRAG